MREKEWEREWGREKVIERERGKIESGRRGNEVGEGEGGSLSWIRLEESGRERGRRE